MTIKLNGEQLISLTDLWKASGKETQMPRFWIGQEDSQKFIQTIASSENRTVDSILETYRGRTGGTYAHPQIALAYAKYLSPELHMFECDVRQGTKRDAILYSVGCNASHGLRRTNADKRKAVLKLLEDSEWSSWSNNKIAERCAVSHTFVNELRKSLETTSSETTYVNKHGQVTTMDTSNIGKSKPKLPTVTTEDTYNTSDDTPKECYIDAIVMPDEFIAGERRFKACVQLGWTEVPCVVMKATPEEQQWIMLSENLQRKDLSEVEKAEAIHEVRSRNAELSLRKLAEKLGVNEAYIRNLLNLAGFPTEVKQMVKSEEVSAKSIRPLSQITKDEHTPQLQIKAAEYIRDNCLTYEKAKDLHENQMTTERSGRES